MDCSAPRSGTPVAVEVFEGNTSDPQTIREQIDKLKRRFKLSHVALIGDRGMITSARISEELAPAGLDWISRLRAPQIAALADLGRRVLFDDRDLAEITSPDFPGERLVACRNPALAKERARKREELLQATERRLTRIANEVRRKPAKHDAGVIGLAVEAVIDKHKMKKHFALDIADGRFRFHRRRDGRGAARGRGSTVIGHRHQSRRRTKSVRRRAVAYKNLALVERASSAAWSVEHGEGAVGIVAHLDARLDVVGTQRAFRQLQLAAPRKQPCCRVPRSRSSCDAQDLTQVRRIGSHEGRLRRAPAAWQSAHCAPADRPRG